MFYSSIIMMEYQQHGKILQQPLILPTWVVSWNHKCDYKTSLNIFFKRLFLFLTKRLESKVFRLERLCTLNKIQLQF